MRFREDKAAVRKSGPRRALRHSAVLAGSGAMLGVLSLWGCGSDSSGTNNTGLPNGRATQAQIVRGRYLVTAVAACGDCHNRGTTNPADPQWLAGYTAGSTGASFDIGPFKTYAPNITPDKDTGIGSWTSQQIFNAFRKGVDDEGKALAPPMPWPTFRNMSDDDTWALVAYLQSLKAVSNAVPESQGPPGADGKPDWSSAYQHLPTLPAYPAGNEVK